jgi:lambda repressor-like predicted transcriptional regulator
VILRVIAARFEGKGRSLRDLRGKGRADASYNNNCSTSCPKERKQTVLNANNPFSDSGKYFFEYDALALGGRGIAARFEGKGRSLRDLKGPTEEHRGNTE